PVRSVTAVRIGWTLAVVTTAPVVLIAGWTVAAARQPGRFSAVRQTISALAARGAADRWIMTSCLAVLGACYLLTAAGLAPARPAGRVLLAVGGLATSLVAAFPQPAHGGSLPHAIFAAIGFGCLASWPVLASTAAAGWALRPATGRLVSAVLLMLLVLFAATLNSAVVGLTERLLAAAEALWLPVVVAVSGRFGTASDCPAGAGCDRPAV
ncbi:MAG: DUF998 domain-containing protein, partial [Jatrophihabitantaceae bacterium]